MEDLLKLRQIGSDLEGHPTPRLPFADVATGSLGQGLSVGVGMALCARMDRLDYRTYVLLGDGECAEGSVWEAASLAGHLQLNNLVAVVDINRLGQSQATALGHDVNVTRNASRPSAGARRKSTVTTSRKSSKCLRLSGWASQPLVILAKTLKGAGVSFLQDKEGWHGKALSQEEATRAICRAAAHGQVRHRPSRFLLPPLCLRRTTSPGRPTLPRLQTRRQSRLARGLRQRPGSHGRSRPAHRRPGRRHQELHLLGKFFKKFPNRFIECFIAEQNMVGVATGFSTRGKVPFAVYLCRLFHPRL